MEPFSFRLATAIDLLALVTCLGTLSCRLWVLPLPAVGEDTAILAHLRAALWRLLGGCLLALTVSSAGELLGRTLTMSGLPLAMLGRTLPIVLLHTHYGRVWFVRLGALVMLWTGWGMGRRRLYTQGIPVSMLVAGVLIAMTRSLSGHAADWGDLTLAVMMDGLHLLAAGVWGGGLLALTCTVLPAISRCIDEQRLLLANVARRFATLASLALAVVLLTGCANAWVQIHTMPALWTTPYGRTLLAKLVLAGLVIFLGAINHYFYVPLLQQQAGRSVAVGWLLHALGLWHILPASWKTPTGSSVAQRWWRTMVMESFLLISVLFCTVLLLHSPPARSASHATHGHVEMAPTPDVHHDH